MDTAHIQQTIFYSYIFLAAAGTYESFRGQCLVEVIRGYGTVGCCWAGHASGVGWELMLGA